MENSNEKLIKKKNHFNIANHKIENKKDEFLCKRYFYKFNMNKQNKNIFHDMESGQNLDVLEQVYNENLIFLKGKNELLKKQTECLKSMILHHKNIPERWIIQNNYKSLLNKAMQDPIVLSYAIFSKDIHKKRSTTISIDVDDIKKQYSLSPKEQKFITYINPYSRNSNESTKKHKIRKEYGYNIKNRKDKGQNIYIIQTDGDDRKKLKKNLYSNTEQNKELPNIFVNKNLIKNKEDDKKTEDKNELTMMTSLYYDENKLYGNKKNNREGIDKNKENNNTDDNVEKIFKKQKKELPMIEY